MRILCISLTVEARTIGDLNEGPRAHIFDSKGGGVLRTFGVQGLEATSLFLRGRIPQRKCIWWRLFYFLLYMMMRPWRGRFGHVVQGTVVIYWISQRYDTTSLKRFLWRYGFPNWTDQELIPKSNTCSLLWRGVGFFLLKSCPDGHPVKLVRRSCQAMWSLFRTRALCMSVDKYNVIQNFIIWVANINIARWLPKGCRVVHIYPPHHYSPVLVSTSVSRAYVEVVSSEKVTSSTAELLVILIYIGTRLPHAGYLSRLKPHKILHLCLSKFWLKKYIHSFGDQVHLWRGCLERDQTSLPPIPLRLFAWGTPFRQNGLTRDN